MKMTPEISRMAKMLIDAEGMTLIEAEARIRDMRLEIVIGDGAHNVAGHTAILTLIAVGRKTFLGGVSIRLPDDVPLVCSLPFEEKTLLKAAKRLGAVESSNNVENDDDRIRIVVGEVDHRLNDVTAWWDGWKAGATLGHERIGNSDNPLAGVAAAGAALAQAFSVLRNVPYQNRIEFDLWPQRKDSEPPEFAEVYLPGSLWLLGLGNLGQAFMWSISALPFKDPAELKLMLQDVDCVGPENWGTSILVEQCEYGDYKTVLAETWAKKKGFDVRRVDRFLDSHQRLQEGEPKVALCSFDNIKSRKLLDDVGYDVVIDSGLGRTHRNFDVYRVTVFDASYLASSHFSSAGDPTPTAPQDYQMLAGLDECGAAKFQGISVAAPFVSTVAGAIAVARTIAICSGSYVPRNEKRRLGDIESRYAPPVQIKGRGIIRIKP